MKCSKCNKELNDNQDLLTGECGECFDAQPPQRLEYLRGELRAGSMSYSEQAELQGLVEHIESGDVELLEAAGVPEFPDDTSPEDWNAYSVLSAAQEDKAFCERVASLLNAENVTPVAPPTPSEIMAMTLFEAPPEDADAAGDKLVLIAGLVKHIKGLYSDFGLDKEDICIEAEDLLDNHGMLADAEPKACDLCSSTLKVDMFNHAEQGAILACHACRMKHWPVS